MALLRRISAELRDLAESSPELREPHFNLKNIRRVLARPSGPGLRPLARAPPVPAGGASFN
ncbi:MAG: hypothetical protein H7X78_08665 [Methyloceanibacter sp.]|jgi:hypothetical protein|nr:hypothetical protein [Methyloceanibacter sp.]